MERIDLFAVCPLAKHHFAPFKTFAKSALACDGRFVCKTEKQTQVFTRVIHVNVWFAALYMSCMSQKYSH